MRNECIFLCPQVFSCLPSNILHTFAAIKVARQEEPMCRRDPVRAKEILQQRVRGHLVRSPEDFPRDEDISPPQTSKENAVPEVVWT